VIDLIEAAAKEAELWDLTAKSVEP
jgi:hypothetical protein